VGGLVADANGNLFGTTANYGYPPGGTVFELVNNNGDYIFKTRVSGLSISSFISATLTIDANGDLFGTGGGSVFEVVNNNGAYTLKTLFNGIVSTSPLFVDANGDLFGTTNSGGTYSDPNTPTATCSAPQVLVERTTTVRSTNSSTTTASIPSTLWSVSPAAPELVPVAA
jgi:hypothetical protein